MREDEPVKAVGFRSLPGKFQDCMCERGNELWEINRFFEIKLS